ncbi:MAG: NAD-dependent epimerase/dehydratase family protein [Woeseiaceae bacterium]
MNVLIVGVNGFLGSAISFAATSRGHNVFGLSRSREATLDVSGTYVPGDRSQPDVIRHIVVREQIDVVVDVIAMTLPDTEKLIAQLDGLVRQYVMLSSSDVYRNYELFHRKATGTPIAGSANEDSALRITRYPYRLEQNRSSDAEDKYLDDYDKIPIELAVQKMASDWTILRLPMVYGPGDKQRRFRWAIEPLLKGVDRIVMPRSWLEWQTTYGFVDNVGAAIATTIGDSRAARRVFNVTEAAPANHFKWLRRFAEVMSWDGDIEVTDDPDDPFARRLESFDLTVPFEIDGRRIREELGFAEEVDVVSGLKRTVSDEANRL